MPLCRVIRLGKTPSVTAEVWHRLLRHGQGQHLRWYPRRSLKWTVLRLATAAIGMALKVSSAQIKLRKALVAGIVLQGMMVDGASAGAALAGPRSSLLGGRTAVRKPKIGVQEAVAATREAPAPAVGAQLGQPQQQQDSTE